MIRKTIVVGLGLGSQLLLSATGSSAEILGLRIPTVAVSSAGYRRARVAEAGGTSDTAGRKVERNRGYSPRWGDVRHPYCVGLSTWTTLPLALSRPPNRPTSSPQSPSIPVISSRRASFRDSAHP